MGYRIRARACRRPGSGPAGPPLRLIAGGYAFKEIARRLGISPKTVEHHVSSVLRKLQLSSRHELTRSATDRRIV